MVPESLEALDEHAVSRRSTSRRGAIPPPHASSACTASRATAAAARGSPSGWLAGPPRGGAGPDRPRVVAVRAAVEHRRARRRCWSTRSGTSPPTWIGHSFGGRLAFELAARRPEPSSGSCCSTRRSCIDPGDRALRRRERAARTVLRLVRRGDRAPLRREPASPRAARATSRGAAGHPRRGRRRALALPLLPGRRDRRVRRDGVGAAAVRGGPHPDAARARRGVVRALRPPARRARAALGDLLEVVTRPRRAHRALGRARGDRRGGRRRSSRRRSLVDGPGD